MIGDCLNKRFVSAKITWVNISQAFTPSSLQSLSAAGRGRGVAPWDKLYIEEVSFLQN